MRSPFVVPCLLALLGCVHAEETGGSSRLPGFPLAAPDEAAGPDHTQRLLALEGETALILDLLASDGRPPRSLELTVDRRGEVIARRSPVGCYFSGTDPVPEEPSLDSLPIAIASGTLELRRDGGRLEVWLRADEGAPIETRLAVLPRAGSTSVEGVALGDRVDERGPAIAALAWRSEEGGARVRGIAVLDLRAGRAALHQKRGLETRRQGDDEAAVLHFQYAWNTDPEDPLAAYNLSCALARLGHRDRALTLLREAVELDGPRVRVLAARDPDLDSLRDHPDFLSIAGPGGRVAREASDAR